MPSIVCVCMPKMCLVVMVTYLALCHICLPVLPVGFEMSNGPSGNDIIFAIVKETGKATQADVLSRNNHIKTTSIFPTLGLKGSFLLLECTVGMNLFPAAM
mmetsp:Transcript_3970/g.8440  ORF Transcript_3970/g.8440 Transcript_3970/m.8440 type:complete len:101 (-) Transcript_3970:684-986(-)